MLLYMLIGYMFLYIHRPFEVWPVLGTVRIELVYMLLITIVWLASPKVVNVNRLTLVIAAFAATMLLGWITSDYADAGTITLTNWLKLLPFYLMVITSIKDERDFKRIMTGFMVVMFIYLSHSLREFYNGRHVYRMGIARMVGVDVMHADPNSFAATVVYVLPMIFPFWATRQNRKQTFAVAAYVALSIACVLLTGSRTGMIGLCMFGLMCILASRRRAIMLFALFLVASLGWLSLPEDLQNRYLTIVDDDRGPKNAQASKDSRYLLLLRAVEIWQDSPLMGYGPGSFPQASGAGIQAHSLYGQALAELGIMGALTLFGFVVCISLNYWEACHLRRILPPDDRSKNFEFQVVFAVFLTMILLLLLGFGGHNFYRYTWIWYAAFQGISLNLLRKQVEKVERQTEPEWEPVARPRPDARFRPWTAP